MIIRRELPSDDEAVSALFATVYSLRFLDDLRASDAWLPNLSFVALGSDGKVAGHIAATRGHVGSAPVLALVPPSVDSSQRAQGVGQALMHAMLGAAEALDESLAGLVADPPEFYSRFGFHAAEEYGITVPAGGWRPYFLVRPLTGYTDLLRGTFRFPDAFGA